MKPNEQAPIAAALVSKRRRGRLGVLGGLCALGFVIWWTAPNDAVSPAGSVLIGERAPEGILTNHPQPAEQGSSHRARARKTLAARLADFSDFVPRDTDPVETEKLIRSWIDDLTTSEMSTALAYLRRADLTQEFVTDIQARIVRHWADLDAGEATDWVSVQPAGPARDLAMENVAIVRANRELPAATAWAQQLPPGASRDQMLAAVATEAARSRPVEALRLAADLPATPANDELIRRAAMEWTVSDPSASRDWAEQIEDETLRGQVLSGVVIAWADAEPAAAATYTADRIPAGRLQDDAIVGIAQRWAQQDTAAVSAWISTFPDGDLRTAASESVAAIERARHQD